MQVETLDDETSVGTAVSKVEYNGFKNTSGGKLSLKTPLESWRTDTTPFYFYKTSINGYEQISYLRASSLPLIGNNTTNRLWYSTDPGTTTIKAVSNGLSFGGNSVQTRDKTTPNFVIFELQGAGGGGAAYGILGYQGKGGNGGGDGSIGEDGKFGAGGGGGRWTLFNTPKNGGKGGDGCCAIYY